MTMNRAYLVVFISCFVLYSTSLADAHTEVASSPISLSVAAEETPVEPVIHNDAVVRVGVVNPKEEKIVVNKVEKSMMMTMAKTDNILKVIKNKMEKTPKKTHEEDCLKTCAEVYKDAIDSMKTSIEDMKSRNYYKANVDITAVGTDMDTCDECYAEMLSQDAELKKFDQWIQGVTGECLNDLQTVNPR